MSFISESATLIGKWVGIGIAIFLVILILFAVINWYVDNQKNLHRNTEVVIESVPVIVEQLIKSCEITDKTMKALTDTLAKNLEHKVARELAEKLLNGGKLSECEWYEFTNHLNDWEKRKLRVYDLVCDFSSCLKQP